LRVEIPDRSDLPFLEAAAAANAILVTGNARHFPRHERAGVIVMTPREFLDFLRGS
jgi:predicted nucleic acid-binding protein